MHRSMHCRRHNVQQLSEMDDNSESEEEVGSLSDESGAESYYTGVENKSNSDVEDEDASVGSSSIHSELTTESVESGQEEEEEEEAQPDSVVSDYLGNTQLQEAGIYDPSDSESASTESDDESIESDDESIESDESVAESTESDDLVAPKINESEQEKKAEPGNVVVSAGQIDMQSRNTDAETLLASESEPEEDDCDLEDCSSSGIVNPAPTFFTQNTVEAPPGEGRNDFEESSVRSRVTTTSNIVSVEPDLSLNLCSDGGTIPNSTAAVENTSSEETNVMKKLNAEVVVSERRDMNVLECTAADSIEVTTAPPMRHSSESAQIEYQTEKSTTRNKVNNTTSLVAEAAELTENLSVREFENKFTRSSATTAGGEGSKEGYSEDLNEQEGGGALPLGDGEMISFCSSSSTKTNTKDNAAHKKVTMYDSTVCESYLNVHASNDDHLQQKSEQEKEVMGYPEKDKAIESHEKTNANRNKINEIEGLTVADAGRLLNREEEVIVNKRTESLGESTDYEKYVPPSRIPATEVVHKGICSFADNGAKCSPNIESTDQTLRVAKCRAVHEKVAESMGNGRGPPRGNGIEIVNMDVTNTARMGNVKMLGEGEKSMLCQEEENYTEIIDCDDPIAEGQNHTLTKEAIIKSVKASYVYAAWKQDLEKEIRLSHLDEGIEMSVSMTKPYEEPTLCGDEAHWTDVRNPEPKQNETKTGKAISSTTTQFKLSNMSSTSGISITSSRNRNIEEGVILSGGNEEVKKEILDANENGGTGIVKCEEKWRKKDGEVVLSGIVSLSQQTRSLPKCNSNALVEKPVVISSYCALHEEEAQPTSFVARLHAKARNEAVKRRMEATEREIATRLHLNTLKKGPVTSNMDRVNGIGTYVRAFDDHTDVRLLRMNDKGRNVRRDFKLSPIRPKAVKRHHQGLEDNNSVFRDQKVSSPLVALSSKSATGTKSGDGGYVSSYRRRILEERQRNKAEKSLQQKALDNKHLNVAQYSDMVRHKAKLRAAKRSQLRSKMLAEPQSNADVIFNSQAQVQNKPYETTVQLDNGYHSKPNSRRKHIITTETERIKQQKAARDQANQQMRQGFHKRREKYTSSNITSSGACTTAIVKPQHVGGGEERSSSPVLNEVSFQPSGVDKHFLYKKRLAGIEAKVYGYQSAFANRKLLSCQEVSSSRLQPQWNKSRRHNTGKNEVEILPCNYTHSLNSIIETIHQSFSLTKGSTTINGNGTSPSSTRRPPYKGKGEKQYVSRDDFIALGCLTK